MISTVAIRALANERVQINKSPFAACGTTPKGFRLALDDITKLMNAGGYLTYTEWNDLIPRDVHSPEDLDDLLTTIGRQGIDVLGGQPKLSSAALKSKFEEEVENGEVIGLVPPPGALEKTKRSSAHLPARDGHSTSTHPRRGSVDIAKRIERGQRRVLKALSRSPIVISQILAIAEDLRRGVRSIKEIVVFDEEEMTEGDPAKSRQGHYAPHRRATEALQKSQPASRTIADHPGKKENEGLPPLPMQAGPRDRSDFAHHPQPRSNQPRARTPDRSGE